jgi:50S ribosomal protein L16 3-hydroxylase
MIDCQFFEKISRKRFFEKYWRKRPLLIKSGVTGLDSLMSKSDIWRMAGNDRLTSRLVTKNSGSKGWTMDFGPFSRDQLNSLPKKHWTVLVQEVDHVRTELSTLRRHFEITPQWLFDDIMVSFASDQGSVGPHVDQYDVFLVQGFGCRRWQISDRCLTEPEQIENLPLKIMKKFTPTMEWLCEPGDVLYLPPMYPHFGVAVGECSTYSVGFRSITQREIVHSFIERVSDSAQDVTLELGSRMYEAGTAGLGKVGLKIIQNELETLLLKSDVIHDAIGSVMTATRRGGDSFTAKTSQKLGRLRAFVVAPDARVMHFESPKSVKKFFANGQRVDVPKRIQKYVATFFDKREIDLSKIKISTEQSKMLRTCLIELMLTGVARQKQK